MHPVRVTISRLHSSQSNNQHHLLALLDQLYIHLSGCHGLESTRPPPVPSGWVGGLRGVMDGSIDRYRYIHQSRWMDNAAVDPVPVTRPALPVQVISSCHHRYFPRGRGHVGAAVQVAAGRAPKYARARGLASSRPGRPPPTDGRGRPRVLCCPRRVVCTYPPAPPPAPRERSRAERRRAGQGVSISSDIHTYGTYLYKPALSDVSRRGSPRASGPGLAQPGQNFFIVHE